MYALKLAAILVKELAGGETCGQPVDLYPEPVAPFPVTLSYDYARGLIGKDIPADTIESILRALEIEIVKTDGREAELRVPTYRVDVQRPCDVVEDILRIYGYNNVDPGTTVHSSLSFKSPTDVDNDLRNLISDQLTAQGFNEILNNSLTAESYYSLTEEYTIDRCVRLLNPLSNDLSVMRQTLLFGGLESIAYNINRRSQDLMMYEFGNVYTFNPAAVSTAERPLDPYTEYSRLGIWMTGAIRPAGWLRPEDKATVYDLRATVDNILTRLGIAPAEIKIQQFASSVFAAGLQLSSRSGKALGSLGIVSRHVLKAFDIKQEVYFAELDWTALVQLATRHNVTYTALPKTMAVKRDLALLIDKSVTMQQIETIVRESERKLLRGVQLFDVYDGDKLPAGKKSYAINITLQDDERTLNDKQIEAVMKKIITNLQQRAGAELR